MPVNRLALGFLFFMGIVPAELSGSRMEGFSMMVGSWLLAPWSTAHCIFFCNRPDPVAARSSFEGLFDSGFFVQVLLCVEARHVGSPAICAPPFRDYG